MTTPQDPGDQPGPASDAAAGQGQWYQDPSGQWWYQDPSGQWYQDPRYAEQSAGQPQQEQPVAGQQYEPQQYEPQQYEPQQYQAPGQYPPPSGAPAQWGGYPAAEPYSGYPAPQADYGQQYPGYQPYAGYPGYGSGFGTATETAKRPGVVIAAAVLWIVSGVLLTIMALVIALYGGTASDADLIEDLDLSVDDFDNIDSIRTGLVAGGIVGAVFGAALVLFGVLLLRRKSWARVLTTILGVISLLPLLITLVGPILVIVAIVLQFLPASNTWFRSSPRSP